MPSLRGRCLAMAASDAFVRRAVALTALLALCLVVLPGCGNASADGGSRMAERFRQAWTRQDSMRALLPQLAAALDSADSRSDFTQAFVAGVEAAGNDTMRLAAMAVTSSTGEFARTVASEVVQPLLDGKSSAVQASRQLSTAGCALAAVGLQRYEAAIGTAVQAMVDGMDVADQMRVYAAASTPGLLGAAMAREHRGKGADTAALSRRVDALRDIYTPAQMREFEQNYYIK